MLDDQLLDEFCRTFYGFGNFNGRYWFIGMEEDEMSICTIP